MIVIQDLCKRFGERKVLNQINLTILEGEIMVIMGPSGCGKSTLLRHINGLLQPDAGQILLDDERISDFTEAEWYKVRKNMGMVFQNAALFDSLTVWENVAFGLKYHTDLKEEEQKKIATAKLGLVGLSGSEWLFPSQLSGGMQKRVSLARAIALNPQIILYDEPTSGLDPIMTHTIDQLILKMQAELGVTSVVVTHDVTSAMRIADRIAVFSGGEVVQIGTPEEVTNSEIPLVRKFLLGEIEEG